MGVGVAALEDERDAADERDHRERGDDDDLAPLAASAERWNGTVRCMVTSCVGGGRRWPVHGCLGQAAASAATVPAEIPGQLYSTESCEVAVKVTPFPNRMLLMNGVIGR